MSEARDFWSRRKARVAAEVEAEEAAVEARAIESDQAKKTDAEILVELNLPDPDSLEPGDDFSGFMAKAVPDRLRVRALRKLWLTNPVLANVDGLVDYGEDFTDAACVIENLTTSYQVGKGMRAHVEEMARQAELKAAEAEADNIEAEQEEGEEEILEPAPDDVIAEAEEAEETEALSLAQNAQDEMLTEAESAPAPRRRMRFQFDDQYSEGSNV